MQRQPSRSNTRWSPGSCASRAPSREHMVEHRLSASLRAQQEQPRMRSTALRRREQGAGAGCATSGTTLKKKRPRSFSDRGMAHRSETRSIGARWLRLAVPCRAAAVQRRLSRARAPRRRPEPAHGEALRVRRPSLRDGGPPLTRCASTCSTTHATQQARHVRLQGADWYLAAHCGAADGAVRCRTAHRATRRSRRLRSTGSADRVPGA